ncbi:MAG: FAD-dependent oxidoreductase [Sphingomonadales bacterium]|nr:FAD-dependent oxidoreductase [Sphingomonadales bacterium]
MANDYDVVVIGGGGAGLCAALEAKAAGASVIVLEADTRLGGATALSGGVFYAAGTSVQRRAGISDSADAMFDYLMTLNHWALKPDIIRYVCDEGAAAIDWLIALGVDFPPDKLVKGGIESVPRAHPSHGAGMGIAEALINAAGAAGIETALGTRVERLLVEEGRVVGVHAGGIDLRAGATVLTTGGFANSAEMIARHYPSAARRGDWLWAVHHHAPFILGDGLTLAEAVEANLTGHDTGLLLPSSNAPGRALEPFMPPWLMMVNREGRRFMPEMSSYTISGYAILEQTDEIAFAIWDEAALREASADLAYLDPYGAGINIPTWEEPTIRDRVARGEFHAADTLAALAERLGIDPLALAETVAGYNADCAAGRDRAFFQDGGKKYPVAEGPFYGAEIRAAVIGVTGAGLDIDRHTRVLDRHNRPVAGLYAAGEVCGVTMGKRYGGGGMSIGPAVILGRLAGRMATAHARGGD